MSVGEVVSLRSSAAATDHDAAPGLRSDLGPGHLHVCFVAMNIYPTLADTTSAEMAGGAEVQQMVLARALVAAGLRVSVLTGDHGQPEVVDCDGIRVHRVPAAGRRGVRGLRFLHPHLSDVWWALRRIDPDIVYFRTAGFRAAAAAAYARRHDKAFVYACASDMEVVPQPTEPSSRRDAILFRWALQRADAVVVQSIRQRRLLKETFGKDGLVLANCYAESGAGRAAYEGPVLWVGTVKTIKSPELFIELARRHPKRRFRMVGGANRQDPAGLAYFDRMRELASQVPNLEFVGHVPFHEVGRQFDGASLLINTSPLEGFPNTFLQAWIRGVPSASFVCPELVAGRPGTIVCKDLDHMSRTVSRLLEGDREHWLERSRACRQHFASIHSVDSTIRGYLELFDRVMRTRAAR